MSAESEPRVTWKFDLDMPRQRMRVEKLDGTLVWEGWADEGTPLEEVITYRATILPEQPEPLPPTLIAPEGSEYVDTSQIDRALALIAEADEIVCEQSNVRATSAESASITWSLAHGKLTSAYTIISSLKEETT